MILSSLSYIKSKVLVITCWFPRWPLEDEQLNSAMTGMWTSHVNFVFTDHIDYIKNLIGADYVGIGADYDGVPT